MSGTSLSAEPNPDFTWAGRLYQELPVARPIEIEPIDAWLEAKYLYRKARKDRWAWNFGIQQERPIAVRENRQ